MFTQEKEKVETKEKIEMKTEVKDEIKEETYETYEIEEPLDQGNDKASLFEEDDEDDQYSTYEVSSGS